MSSSARPPGGGSPLRRHARRSDPESTAGASAAAANPHKLRMHAREPSRACLPPEGLTPPPWVPRIRAETSATSAERRRTRPGFARCAPLNIYTFWKGLGMQCRPGMVAYGRTASRALAVHRCSVLCMSWHMATPLCSQMRGHVRTVRYIHQHTTNSATRGTCCTPMCTPIRYGTHTIVRVFRQ